MQMKKLLITFILGFIIVICVFIYIWEKYEVIKTNQELEALYYNKQKLEQTKKELIIKKDELLAVERIQSIAKEKLKMKDVEAKDMRILEVNK